MTKNFIYTASALLLGSAITLTSCQSEEDFGLMGGNGEVLLTVTANRGVAGSRTSFEESEGNLITNWNEGDQLVVTDATGANLGVLTIISGQNTSEGVFEGTIKLGDNENVNIVYLGSGYEGDLEEVSNKVVFNISAQDGTFAGLTEKDYLTETAPVTKLNGTEATAKVNMTRSLAHGYFTLALPDGVTLAAGDQITITANEGLYAQRTLKLGGFGISNLTTSNTITVTKAEAGNDFYLTVIPGTFAPQFTVVKDDVTYTASLASRSWSPAEYVRANENNDPVKITDWSYNKLEADGKIFGIEWAGTNTRSWIDCATYDDDAYYFSYIPGIPFEDQGVVVQYTDASLSDGKNNANAYHFQWGRNFGFPTSTGNLSATRVPNYLNIPLSWGNKYTYYQVTSGPRALDYSYQNPDCYIYTSSNDWCSTNLEEWPIIIDGETYYSAAPKGFRLPTADDFMTLLPTGESGVSFTATKSLTVNGVTTKPVYAKDAGDGSTVVWTIENSTMNYMSLYRLRGSYTLDDITASLLSDETKILSYVDFPAQGCRPATAANSQSTDWTTRGWYWASSSRQTGYADVLRFDISGNTLTIYVAGMPKRNAMSVRCIVAE